MKAEIKAQWVAALRSGDYKQGKSRLFDLKNNTYCCLGVLADLHDALDGNGCVGGVDGHDGHFSTRLRSTLGLKFTDEQELVCMNDSGSLFPEIADHIEKNL